MSRILTGFFIVALGAALTVAFPNTEIAPQQLVYQAQGSLPDGTRIGIFLPAVPIALGIQSKSGPRVMTVGDIFRCKPFDEQTEAFRKTANGTFEPSNAHQQLLNCGPMIPGGADRILAVVGIQWRQ